MKECRNSQNAESESTPVTYVVVVHGMGEQRKNETVIKVVNRFAEARRGAKAKDNRDVLTLGQATGQTGLPNVPPTGQPWMEFEGIRSKRTGCKEVFLGEPSSSGDNLRFVDLWWADILRDAHKQAGQDVEDWAKGLVGRLLRKHDYAKGGANKCARVPFWIRRVLYLLADALLLVRFAMNFRFKEMKELVFVKYLGDVQVYGEYDRCRGLAVRRFHETMAKIEAAHNRREPERKPRYVIIAHSLGSVMSFDALLYAHVLHHNPCGRDSGWVLPGYERESTFAFLKTGWIQRVESFVTLGSPIDKFLMLWWLKYRYLLKSCVWCQLNRSTKISHFNYCDELDPVGHNLDVAHCTPAYKAVFERCEDVVFNRYAVPGAAHNEYWTDQDLFSWILDQAVDGADPNSHGPPPRWYSLCVYFKLLFWLYSAIPLLVLVGTYASLSLAFQASDWRTAAGAAGVLSFLAYFGRRLIDLGIWWRQIQRQESESFWEGKDSGDDSKSDKSKQPCAGVPDPKQRFLRCCGTWVFRILVAVVPLAWAAVAATALLALDLSSRQCVLIGVSVPRLALVIGVSFVVLRLLKLRNLPRAYRVPTVNCGVIVSALAAGVVFLGLAVVGTLVEPRLNGVLLPLLTRCDVELEQAALFSLLAFIVYAYRLYRFCFVKCMLYRNKPEAFDYSKYAEHPKSQRTACRC